MSTQGTPVAVTPATGLVQLPAPYGSAVGQKWQLQVLNLTPYELILNVSGSQQILAAGLIHVYVMTGAIDVTATPIVPAGSTGTGTIYTVWAYGEDTIDGTYPVPSLIQANQVTIVGGNVSVTGPVTVTNDQIVLFPSGTLVTGVPQVVNFPAGMPPIHALSLYSADPGISPTSKLIVFGTTTARIFYDGYLFADQARFRGAPIVPCTSQGDSAMELDVIAGSNLNDFSLIAYTSAVPPLPTPKIPSVQVVTITWAGASVNVPILAAPAAGNAYVLESCDYVLPAGTNDISLATAGMILSQAVSSVSGVQLDKFVSGAAIVANSTGGGGQITLRYRLSNAPDGSDVDI